MDMRAYSMEAWNAPHPAGASPGPHLSEWGCESENARLEMRFPYSM